MTPSEALLHIRTLVEASADLKDDTRRKVLLRSVVVVAQKGLGVAPLRIAPRRTSAYSWSQPLIAGLSYTVVPAKTDGTSRILGRHRRPERACHGPTGGQRRDLSSTGGHLQARRVRASKAGNVDKRLLRECRDPLINNNGPSVPVWL